MRQPHAERPYLDAPADLSAREEIVDWARYLGTTFGTSGSLAALRYYEQLEWISPSVRQLVERHLIGLSLDEIHNKKYDEPGILTGPLESLSGTPFGAHARSLAYIAAIAGEDLEDAMFRARQAEHRADERSTPRAMGGNPGRPDDGDEHGHSHGPQDDVLD